ncbi:MAG: GNAT family N-acetyltransferase [Anaerolineae bacterium]|nr:GNAT family N-acetyltransferase [Anaerolineae bacterium]
MSANLLTLLPTLTTPRLTLRKLAMSDLNDFFEHGADPEVARFTLWEPPQNLAQARKHLTNYMRDSGDRHAPTWGIVLNEENKLIGTCGFHHISPYAQNAEIGYTLTKAYWGRGLATEAVRAALDFGFKQAKLQQVTARTTPENTASARVLKKLGFRQTGSMLEYVPISQQMQRLDIYQLDYFL